MIIILLLTWIYGATSPTDLTFGQLGIAAVVCVLLLGSSLTLWRAYQGALQRIEALQLERIKDAQTFTERERELADRVVPLLAEAVRVLSTAPQKFDQALEQAQSVTRTSEVELMMRKVEDAVEQIARRERGR